MTSRFEDFDSGSADSDLDSSTFELLSAYLDGELSPEQKQQVQVRLDQDPKVKRIYAQLLTIQGNLQHSLAPSSDKSVAEVTAGVFQSIERRRHNKRLFWGVSALAAGLVAILNGNVPGRPQLAQQQIPEETSQSTVMLAVAINKPAINIPKTAEGWQSVVDN